MNAIQVELFPQWKDQSVWFEENLIVWYDKVVEMIPLILGGNKKVLAIVFYARGEFYSDIYIDYEELDLILIQAEQFFVEHEMYEKAAMIHHYAKEWENMLNSFV